MAYKDRHNIARRTRNPQSDTRLSFVQLESVLKVTTHEYHQPTCMCNNNMYKRDTNNQHVCTTTCTRVSISRTPPIFGPARPTSHIFPKFKAAVGSPPSTAARENRERTEREQREIEGVQGILEKVSSVKRSQVPVIEAF
jgi:hypothetical protein